LTTNPEPVDLQADHAKLIPQKLASNPGSGTNMETLMRLASQLGIEFTIDVRPAGSPARNVTKRAQIDSVVGTFRTDEAELLGLMADWTPGSHD
jgi:hypothetical protein